MKSVLVIDDDRIVRDALKSLLSRAGYRVLTAADGANGVLLYRNSKPDLVILDRNLPFMSGSHVFDNIRKISQDIPVIVLSGYNDPEEVDAYLRCGAAAFLSKGLGLSPVLEEVDRLLGGVNERSENGGGCDIPCPVPKPAVNRPLILIADDDPATRRILSRVSSLLSCETIEAEDGNKAVELARSRRPDIVLLDIAMPGKSGIEVLKELAPEMPGTGFMMISGGGDEEIAAASLEQGAFDYVPKPINLATVGTVIRARLLMQRA